MNTGTNQLSTGAKQFCQYRRKGNIFQLGTPFALVEKGKATVVGGEGGGGWSLSIRTHTHAHDAHASQFPEASAA